MADHSVGARHEYESEASEALVLCFDNTSPEKSCFVDGLVCFISLCLLVFVFLNATRRENSGSMEFTETKEVSRRSPLELKFVRYILRLEDITKSVKWRAYVMSGGVPTQLPAQYLSQGKEKLLLRDILCLKRRSCLPPPALYSDS